jgi:hypothetical protein
MNDRNILQHIDDLVKEEHDLWRRSEQHAGLEPAERERLHALKVELDQYWDVLDQRRALRGAGRDPDDARIREPRVVENYKQ